MELSRRSLLEQLAACGGLAALLAEHATGQTRVRELGPGEVKASDYWRNYYDDSRSKSLGASVKEGSDLRVLYFDPTDKLSSLRYSDQIKPEELLDHPGDVTLDVSLSHFQPGADDSQKIRQYDSSQLRLECLQTHPFLEVLAPATWVALASLYPNSAGKLPSLQTLGFPQATAMSGPNKVILPQGEGKFSVNVSSMTKESVLHKILRQGIQVGKSLSPLIGFPAISIPAAVAFSSIYSVLEEHAYFIMKSDPIAAAATQRAANDAKLPAEYLPLRSGEYVFVPARHTDLLTPKLSNLQMNNGLLVDKTLPTNVPVQDRAKNSLPPEVTYLSVKIAVSKLDTSSSSGSSSALNSIESSDSSSSGSTSAPKKPTATKPGTKKP